MALDTSIPSSDGTHSADSGDVSFVIFAMALVFMMIPGVAFFYSGLSRRKNALFLIWAVSASSLLVILQWYLFGYSLAFSRTADNGVIGNLHNFAFIGILGKLDPAASRIPELLYSAFQMVFACSTAAVIIGGIAERGRVLPAIIYSFFWVTFVYCPLAYWIWGTNGWAAKWGVLDFSGGGPVEIGSGVAGLAYAWVLGRRRETEFRPHSVSMVWLGTFLLWFGWLGFNGGSALGASLRAIVAIWNSMISATFSGIVWCLLDFRLERRWTAVGLCSGILVGLVAATPASGYIPLWSSAVMGTLTGSVCNFSSKLKYLVRIDDTFDLFAEHAIGGAIGLIFNGLFAHQLNIDLDGDSQTLRGGWIDHRWKQLYIQVIYICAVGTYTFIVSAILAKFIGSIPGLHLRSTAEAEKRGMDEEEIGEFAWDFIQTQRSLEEPLDFESVLEKKEISLGSPAMNDEDRHPELTVSNGGGVILPTIKRSEETGECEEAPSRLYLLASHCHDRFLLMWSHYIL